MSIEEKYVFTTAEESVLERDWAAGSSKVLESKEYIISRDSNDAYIGEYKKVKYAPAWLKSIDEPIVNALDHLIRCSNTPTPVTWIKVEFEPSGRVHVSNNGPGIEVVVHKTATEKFGVETWVPEFIFGNLFQGSNRKKTDDSIIGGTNGIGSKISNIFSDEFVVETVDGPRQLYYLQKWHNKMSERESKLIVDLCKPHKIPLERASPHTTLSFMPSYSHFGYESFTADTYNELADIIRTRVMFAAAYAKFAAPVNMYFNNELVNVSLADIASIMFPGAACIRTMMTKDAKSKSRIFPWEVCAVVNNKDASGLDINQLSNVNGIVVREGKHTKFMFTKIIDGVKDKIIKLFKDKNMTFKPSYITNNVFILANTQIPNPSWTGQRKDVLDVDVRKLANYKFDKRFIDSVTDKLKDHIIEDMFNERPASKKKVSPSEEYAKYKPARRCTSSNIQQRLKCSLLACEGDSAMTQTCTGITNNSSMGFEYYGVISLGGVIMNARKECIVIETATGVRRIKKSTKLNDNIFMNALCHVTGLNFTHKYDPKSPTYKKEMTELRYGCIIACVDQDYDGVGNIFGLLLNVFELFWPNLITSGYIKRFDTPKIRAYPKKGGKIIEFYNDDEYAAWIGELEAAQLSTDGFAITYYKGLGTHSRDETIHMFKNFQKHVYTYFLDQNSHKIFEIYYGNDPDLRKVALAQPTAVPAADILKQQANTMQISCSDHLDYETKTFQKDSIERHLDHALDGFNQSGRMIFDGSQKAFRASNKKMKVAQLAGYISEHENYHHGEASLAESISGKALITVGGKQIPQLLPYGQFGSRLKGGKDAAHPRYISTKLNKAAMQIIFSELDYWMLEFTFDEGKRGAPKYYLPIIPMSVLESTELPGHGWKLKTWGRDVFKVIDNVRRLIRLGDDVQLLAMPAYTHGWKGHIQSIRGEPYSFGVYEYIEKENIIKILELPLRVWTDDYLEKLRKKDGPVIAAIIDSSDDRTVNIEIKLKPGAMQWLQDHEWGDSVFTDSVEEYFTLRDHMDSNLNMIGARGEVKEFKTYEEIIMYWFPFRKQMYEKRITRQLLIIRLKICYYTNLIRYINEHITLNNMKVADMECKLAASTPPYDRIYCGKLFTPKFTPTENLEEEILHGPKANYDYLLDLSDRKKSKENLTALGNSLATIEAEQGDLEDKAQRGRFPGAYIWESELDDLEAVIRDGRATDWMGEEKNKYSFE